MNDCKEIKLVNPKGNQPWIFIGRTDAEAETPILWPPDAKNWLIGKDPDAGEYWRQGEKETTENEMVGWHHRLNGHEFEKATGYGKDREAWHAAVHGLTKNQAQLSDWTAAIMKTGKLTILRSQELENYSLWVKLTHSLIVKKKCRLGTATLICLYTFSFGI